MRSVRQFYVYAVAGVTLVIAAIGVINLLGLGIDLLLSAVTGQEWIEGSPNWERERLSFSLPFIVIAGPIWFLHWRMAERAVSGPDAEAERRSEIRAAYFALAFLAGLLLLPGITTVVSLPFGVLLGNPLAAQDRESVVTSLAVVLVTAAVWEFHRRIYSRDIRAETTETRSALLPQIALYAVSAIAGIVLLISVSSLITFAIDTMLDSSNLESWWRLGLANSVGNFVAGGLLWPVTWFYTERLLTTSTWWGQSALGSGVRRLFVLAVAVIAAFVVLMNVADAIEVAVRLALGAPERGVDARPNDIVGPLLASLPFIAAWIVSRRRLLAEAAGIGFPLPLVTAQRLFSYPMAFLGLLLGSAGLAMLLGELFEVVTGADNWRTDVGWPLGLTVAGGVLWGWHWRATSARFAREPVAEQLSPARRVYLFVVLGVALVVLVIGLAITVYQVLQLVLGVSDTARLAAEIALPLGITLTTLVVSAYHGLLLRRDLAVRATTERVEMVNQAETVARTQVALVLTGPADDDVTAVIDALRRQLPEGYDIST
jgi:hypothetical protein